MDPTITGAAQPRAATLIEDTLVVRDGKSYIAYSPFSSLIARIADYPHPETQLYQELAAAGFFQQVPASTRRDSEWSGFTSLTLLLTRNCNLGCTYCYASAKPGGLSMPRQLALDALEWFARTTPMPYLRVTFHGGGEPTLEFETIREVYDRSEQIRGARNTYYHIVTNGTASRHVMDWLVDRGIQIAISMDGPPSIQDRNRPLAEGGPSSQLVEDNIRHLVARDVRFTIRMTYSPTDDIEEVVHYFGRLGVRSLHLEPLFPHGRDYDHVVFGRLSDYEVAVPGGGEILRDFLRAIDIAKQYGMRIYNGHLTSFTRGIGYFCGAAAGRSMMVGHDGMLTGCLEVVDSNDKDAATFASGRWIPETHEFTVHSETIAKFQSRHADALPECRSCFARYTCAGGCAVKAVRASGSFFERDLPYCQFTRALTPILVKRIARATGV